MCLISRSHADTAACKHMETTCLQMERPICKANVSGADWPMENPRSSESQQEALHEVSPTPQGFSLPCSAQCLQLLRNTCGGSSLVAAPALEAVG